MWPVGLFLALLAVLGASTFEALVPSILINAAVLAYSLWPDTRRAFVQA